MHHQIGINIQSELQSSCTKSNRNCGTCARPNAHCVCHCVSKLNLQHVHVWLLTHPLELKRPTVKQTGRFCKLGLNKCEFVVGRRFNLNSDIVETLTHAECIVLFPSPNAIDIRNYKRKSDSVNLFVIDGSWKHAREIVRNNNDLFQNVTFVDFGDLPIESKFAIRKQPQGGTVCTLEAVALALRFLEPLSTTDEENLLAPIRLIVQQQQEFMSNRIQTTS